jgi:hypothetical protein
MFLFLLRLALFLNIWSILEKVPWAADKKVYCQKLDEIFCRHQLGAFDLWCDLDLRFLHWFFCFDVLPICDRGYWSLPLPLCWRLYMFLGLSEYVWWNWVHWLWVHIGW